MHGLTQVSPLSFRACPEPSDNASDAEVHNCTHGPSSQAKPEFDHGYLDAISRGDVSRRRRLQWFRWRVLAPGRAAQHSTLWRTCANFWTANLSWRRGAGRGGAGPEEAALR